VLSAFRSFLLRTNAIAVAVGVIIGSALGTVVTSLVNDIIMPPIGLILGGVDFSSLAIVLKAPSDPADPTTGVAIRWGAFLNAIIAFVVIAFAVSQISRAFTPAEAPAATKACPFCREANAVDASKCRACTSAI